MGRVAIAIGLVVVAAGCGGDDATTAAPPPRTDLGGALLDPGAGSGDVVVATVDGRPVWASCVEGHVRARRVTVEQALDDCIDLELLAAAAVARDLARDPDLQSELRASLVDRFVGREFEDKFRTAADLPPALVAENVERNKLELDRPEIRTAVYVRAKLDKTATPSQDAAARAIAEAIYGELRDDAGVLPHQLVEVARRLGGAHAMDVDANPWQTPRHGHSEESFAAALFAIPDIGRVSPPTRTPWGWDVILLQDLAPAIKRTRDELAAQMFPTLRHFFFDRVWTAELQKKHAVEQFPDRLPLDETDEPEPAPDGSGGAP